MLTQTFTPFVTSTDHTHASIQFPPGDTGLFVGPDVEGSFSHKSFYSITGYSIRA